MSCRDMDRLIQLYVDQDIDEEEKERLRDHVSQCDSCRQSLQEMVALVHSLEEIRRSMEPRRPAVILNHFIKWAAVYTAIAFLVYFVPQMEQHKMEEYGTESMHVHSTVTVLATGAEKLHIPDSDYIQVMRPRNLGQELDIDTALVYPSAVPSLLEDEQDWYKRIKRFVFVKVPDPDTLKYLLLSAGFSKEELLDKEWKRDRFPTSVILTTGKQYQLETFTFPDNEKNISRWFDQLATTTQ